MAVGKSQLKVAVVGAGLAGLSAGYELAKIGAEVVLFEAEAAVGGRVHSVKIGEHSVDVGGFIIYPWYTEYHRLITELGLENKLKPIGEAKIFYRAQSGEMQPEPKFSLLEKWKLAWPLFTEWLRHWPNFRQPHLAGFKNQTVAQFLDQAGLANTRVAEFLDTVNQGYCYAPLSEYEMNFYAPFVYQTVWHGDLRTGTYFGGNNQLFTEALAEKIKSLGGEIRLSMPVTAVGKNMVEAGGQKERFDAIILAAPVNGLHQSIISAPIFSYTHFYAAIVKLAQPVKINRESNWSALFVAPEKTNQAQITSLIQAQSMVSALGPEYLIINYKVLDSKPISNTVLEARLNAELSRIFPGSDGELIVAHQWSQTMPVATSAAVKEIRTKQGQDAIYFAGDFLGAPSMETAVASGVSVAELIKQASQ